MKLVLKYGKIGLTVGEADENFASVSVTAPVTVTVHQKRKKPVNQDGVDIVSDTEVAPKPCRRGKRQPKKPPLSLTPKDWGNNYSFVSHRWLTNSDIFSIRASALGYRIISLDKPI